MISDHKTSFSTNKIRAYHNQVFYESLLYTDHMSTLILNNSLFFLILSHKRGFSKCKTQKKIITR